MSWNNTVTFEPSQPSSDPYLFKIKSSPSKVENDVGYFVVPTFTYTPWRRTTFWQQVAQFNFSADRAFSLQRWTQPQPNEEWFLTIGYRRGNWKTRFKLWDVDDVVFELYQAQVIHNYFIIELWIKPTTYDPITIDPITCYTSLRRIRDLKYLNVPYARGDYDFGAPQVLTESDFLLNCSPPTLLIQDALNINPDYTGVDNTSTINELVASSGKTASNPYPASYP